MNSTVPSDIDDGVYAGTVEINHTIYPAAIFVGAAVTFGETERQIEAHLLDVDQPLTGEATFHLKKFIRPNQQFTNEAALKVQMRQDIIEVRKCLQELSANN